MYAYSIKYTIYTFWSSQKGEWTLRGNGSSILFGDYKNQLIEANPSQNYHLSIRIRFRLQSHHNFLAVSQLLLRASSHSLSY